ncbi:biotin--[acetyl-CoA-carboxylase] ligase [Pseudomonadota bacterium]
MSSTSVQPEPLDKAAILHKLDPLVRNKLTRLNIEATVDSTNSALQRLPLSQQHATAILAEHQSSGRGRRGRQWHSPYGKNLYLSLGWRFDKPLSELGCLPLVLALAAAKALNRAGLRGHRVKWPNDLLLDGRKLCGCLVEMQGESQGPCHAVLGVGINIHMPATGETAGIDQPWTDLHSQLPGFSRNDLAALLLEELVDQLVLFDDQGFVPFQDVWEAWDGLYGQAISAHSGNSPVSGMASGVDDSGALLLDTGAEILKLHSGEVSLLKTKL